MQVQLKALSDMHAQFEAQFQVQLHAQIQAEVEMQTLLPQQMHTQKQIQL